MRKLFVFLIILLLSACGDGESQLCNDDFDGDGYVTGADCSDVDPSLVDCDDNNPYLWGLNSEHSCAKKCIDQDQDGYFSECDAYPQTEEGIEKIDCDDTNERAWTRAKDGTCAFPCSDHDQDGYFFKCEGEYPDGKRDCYDNNQNIWRFKEGTDQCLFSCVDRDGDGYFTGCDHYPDGKIDCDDRNPRLFTVVSDSDFSCKNKCLDQDQDGHYIQCDLYDEAHPKDACDRDPANWVKEQCRYIGESNEINPQSTCVDQDGDGYYLNCNRYTELVKGPDCDDRAGEPFAFDNWFSCNSCVDTDLDGYFVGCDRFSAKTKDQFGLLKDFNDQQANLEQYDLLIILNQELKGKLDQELLMYKKLYPDKGINVIYFENGTHKEMMTLIKTEYLEKGIKGVWLIGSLPTAWFEMDVQYDPSDPTIEHEEFPFDYYYSDLKTEWYDHDHDGLYDHFSESKLNLSIYTAHLLGSLEEMKSYFQKLKQYHETGSLIEPSVFVFIDDDWQYAGNYRNTYALTGNYLKSQFTWYSNKEKTTQEKYLDFMSKNGAEFIFQWIHADPANLYFNVNFGHDILNIDTMDHAGIKGSFFNLFNCSGSRFTERNLATFYTHQPYGLATIGSAKTGALLDATQFHHALGKGKSWGEAYQYWYNQYGATNNDWHMAIVIQGDPLLTLSKVTRRVLSETPSAPLTPEYLKMMRRSIKQYQKLHIQVNTFKDYCNKHPNFIEK